MPIVSMFFGIVIRMYYDEHAPPHFHAEYQGKRRFSTSKAISSRVISIRERRQSWLENGLIFMPSIYRKLGIWPGKARICQRFSLWIEVAPCGISMKYARLPIEATMSTGSCSMMAWPVIWISLIIWTGGRFFCRSGT